ncbi:MAG: phosphoesterase [Thermoguttaceae bacterium]|nr:phosphoesterase [Thermoguttaceae bacterium]
MSSKEDERVLVAPTELFRSIGTFQGVLTESLDRYDPLFAPDATRFMRRGDAELDPNFKQLIPYVVFTCEQDGKRLVFAYRRGKGQGEARLRSKWSVGIGGHVNDGDLGDAENAFDAGTKREIAEEVSLDANIASFARVGLVNDDSTEVGSVHLGVVCRVELDAPKLRSNEPDLLEARFREVGELLAEIDEAPERFESWTVFAMRDVIARE